MATVLISTIFIRLLSNNSFRMQKYNFFLNEQKFVFVFVVLHTKTKFCAMKFSFEFAL